MRKDTSEDRRRAAKVDFTAHTALPERGATHRAQQLSPGPRAPICVHAAALQSPDRLLASARPPQRRAQTTTKMFAPSGPEPIVAIKAGKCKVEPHCDEAKRAAGKLWITPQKDRGEVIVVKKDDVNHFQWRSREMPCAVDPNIDTMVFPGADPA